MNPITKTTTPANGNVANLMFILLFIAAAALVIFLLVLVIRALMKRVRPKSVQEEKPSALQNLSKALKEQRIKNDMTQESVAEALGVSRQSVSEWENGTSVPGASDLLALSELYKISLSDLLNSNNK